MLRTIRKPVAAVLAAAMTLFSAPILPAQAAIVGTDQVIRSAGSADARDTVRAFLARDDVQAQMRAFGVSPGEAKARVDALSDDEVGRIAGRIDALPSGEGALGAVIGAIVIVGLLLLLTDLLGLTHVYSFTNKGSLSPN